MSQVEAVCIPPERCEDIWPHVEGFIAKAFGKAGQTMPDYADDFASCRRLLWIAATPDASILGAGITRLQTSPEGLRCILEACGGREFARWRHTLARLEAYAKAEGAAEFIIEGARSGWRRLLPDYRASGDTLSKRLS
jgi:hypothetical protein